MFSLSQGVDIIRNVFGSLCDRVEGPDYCINIDGLVYKIICGKKIIKITISTLEEFQNMNQDDLIRIFEDKVKAAYTKEMWL